MKIPIKKTQTNLIGLEPESIFSVVGMFIRVEFVTIVCNYGLTCQTIWNKIGFKEDVVQLIST